jgi:hypothetical protein
VLFRHFSSAGLSVLPSPPLRSRELSVPPPCLLHYPAHPSSGTRVALPSSARRPGASAKVVESRLSRESSRRLEIPTRGGVLARFPWQLWHKLPGVGLSASFASAAAARHALVLDDLAIKVVLGLDKAAKEHPAVHAGVGALEASVVRLYSVVVILSGWLRGCARLLCGHEAIPSWSGSRGAPTPAGPSLYPTSSW